MTSVNFTELPIYQHLNLVKKQRKVYICDNHTGVSNRERMRFSLAVEAQVYYVSCESSFNQILSQKDIKTDAYSCVYALCDGELLEYINNKHLTDEEIYLIDPALNDWIFYFGSCDKMGISRINNHMHDYIKDYSGTLSHIIHFCTN